MKQGDLIKEKREYIIEKFTTKEGLFDFFIISAIWGFIVVKFSELIYTKIYTFLEPLVFEPIRIYLSYLFLAIILTGISLILSICIIAMFRGLVNLIKTIAKR